MPNRRFIGGIVFFASSCIIAACSMNSTDIGKLAGQSASSGLVPVNEDAVRRAEAGGLTIPARRPMLPEPFTEAIVSTLGNSADGRHRLTAPIGFQNPGSSLTRFPAPQTPNGPAATAIPAPTAKPTTKPTVKPSLPPKCGSVASRYVVCPQTNARSPYDATTTDNGGGIEGYANNGGTAAGDGSFYVAHQILTNVVFPAVAQNDPQQAQTLYAPTTHGPNGNCFEVTTAYTTGVDTPLGITSPEVALYNFCDPNPLPGQSGRFEGSMTIDQNFINKYVAVFGNGNGTPEYVTQVSLQSDGKWHYYLANLLNNPATYDDIYDSAANQRASFNNGQGWSYFETHYAIGTCADVDSTSMSGLRYYVNNTWQYATANTSVLYPNVNGGTYSCFNNYTGAGNFYDLQYQSADFGWTSYTQTNS